MTSETSMTSRRKYDRDEIKRLLRSGLTHDEVAKEIGCSLKTVVITAREMWDEDGWGRVRWTKAQENALMQLVDGLADRWGTTPELVSAHAYMLVRKRSKKEEAERNARLAKNKERAMK